MTTDTFKVEKNIPIPKMLNGSNALKYPWKTMKIGDSFLLPKGKSNKGMGTCARQQGLTIKTRTVENGQVRVWRIS